jgi:hypothetical protein
MFAIRTPGFDSRTNEGRNVIMYLWTAPGRDTAAFRRASGVTDDQSRARQAAELLLRTGQAATAYIECAYTAMAAATLNSCYVRTGAGWWAQLSQAGQVVWTPFTTSGGSRREAGPATDAGS